MNMDSCSCCNGKIAEDKVAELAATLKTVSEPNRLRVLCALQNGEEHCVCELTGHVSDASQSLLSHHLADLRDAGLVTSEKRGLRVYYQLTEAGRTVTRTILSLTKEKTT